ILTKPGALTGREYDQMKTHAAIGEEILDRISLLAEVAPIVGQHHERLDGSGYPRGLRGEDILLEARILAVSDTFDAMTTTRPYRPALPWPRAVDEISAGAGTVFDPEVVTVFLRYVEGEEAQWITSSPV
ncbi:MAG: HD-GYP domain-containing protein, partial [Acidimicrobiia bacterium]